MSQRELPVAPAGQDRPTLRQFGVTITEHNTKPVLTVMLRWRTFPCAASHWDGVVSAEVPWGGGHIRSQDALREALGALAQSEWQTGPVPRP